MIDGLVVVDKAEGWTSHDVVAKLRSVYGQKRVGHAGTLDPGATGVLLVGLGRVTRLLRFLQDAGKSYRGRIAFGVATDTLDAAGEVLAREPMPLERDQVETALRRFTGEIEQLPPMVSAVKVSGRKLYELAREGREVERPSRRVTVTRFDLLDFEPGPFPVAEVLVECSSGTYVRALAADLGTALGGCAHLAALRRFAVGPFSLDDAHSVEEVVADPDDVVLEPLAALRGMDRVEIDAERARAASHGAVFPASVLLGSDESDRRGPFAVVGPGATLIAVYERRGTGCKPAVVVAPAGGGDGPTNE